MEKAFVDFLGSLVGIVGDLAAIFVKNEAWGVVATLFILLAVVMYFARKDRLERDNSLGDLLETRNKQILEAFDKATTVVQSIVDLEDKIDAMDRRCDERQKARQQKRKGE